MFLVDWIKVSERGDFRKECEAKQEEKIAVEIALHWEIASEKNWEIALKNWEIV